jgi:hypothetical protein
MVKDSTHEPNLSKYWSDKDGQVGYWRGRITGGKCIENYERKRKNK